MFKKAAIAAFVILSFVIYSLHQRSEGAQAISQIAENTRKSTTPTTSSSTSVQTTINSGAYKDGTFIGKSSDAVYGYIRVKAIVSGGRLTDVEFLDYPQDRRNSVEINDYAMPQLKSRAIHVQSSQVDGVSGATDTSQAFIESLGDALNQAKA